MKHAIITRWLATPNQGRTHFPHKNWSTYDYPFHSRSEGSHAPLNDHTNLHHNASGIWWNPTKIVENKL